MVIIIPKSPFEVEYTDLLNFFHKIKMGWEVILQIVDVGCKIVLQLIHNLPDLLK